MKALLPLVNPIGFIWLLLCCWLIWMLWRGQRRGLWAPGLAWIIYTVMTCTQAPSIVMAHLENTVPHQKVTELPVVDAIVCLGGIAGPSKKELTGFHLSSAADRLSTALVLYSEKKAPALVLGGGAFSKNKSAGHGEADQLLQWAARIGVNATGIVSLGVCSSTHDEAVKVAALMQQRGWKRIILVTSAAHMPRSMAVFKTQGIDLTPAPCNYMSEVNRTDNWDWIHLPNNDGFEVFGAWIYETIGMQVYRLRGWIK